MSSYLQGNDMATTGAAVPTPAPAPALPKAVTVPSLLAMRAAGNKIAMLTCYDASFASLMDRCGVDILLIGDSLGMVCAGYDSTLPVTVADMVYHTASVARGNKSALVLADMPFGSYGNPQQAYDSAVQLMRAGAHMVKIEGGAWVADTVRLLVERGIPVCAHIGLTPQFVHQLGGFKVQGKTGEGCAYPATSINGDIGAKLAAAQATQVAKPTYWRARASELDSLETSAGQLRTARKPFGDMPVAEVPRGEPAAIVAAVMEVLDKQK